MNFRRLPVFTIALASLMLTGHGALAAGLRLKVTGTGYLRGRGVSVMLYNDTYSPVFFDQKNAGMQIILHGHRIATNGSVRLLPTPQQWDRIPQLDSHHVEPARGRIAARFSYPAFHFKYQVVVKAEPGGVRVSVNLDKPLPPLLQGRAGFNLEFLPSLYRDRTYVVDHKVFGILPRYPEDRMVSVPPRPGNPKEPWYVAQWHRERGYMQPLPFATGHSITLAAADPLYRITVTSQTGRLRLYDGRDLAQNGWFVLRTVIPPGKTHDAVVWNIRPHYIAHWIQPPMIAHSQAGYSAAMRKVAVIQLDPRFAAPKSAELLRLSTHGSFRRVYTAPVSAPMHWLRYDYVKFNFSAIRKPGLYEIEYAGQRSDAFPIAPNVYTHTWQTTLDGFLAVQMDHVSVRDAYHVWHGLSDMSDALQAPPNLTHFDGYFMGPNIESPYKPGEHIPGLNIGGWYDAGDFDNDAFGQYATIQNLALTYATFHPQWDELTVNEKTRSVVMHKPDGVPDLVEQVEQGVLQTLAQIHAFGHTIMGIQQPYLEGYTATGDAASLNNGLIYNPKYGPGPVKGIHSGWPDDTWAWTQYRPSMEYAAAASLAAASVTLRGWNDPLSRKCLATAIELWHRMQTNPPPRPHWPPFTEGSGGYREHAMGPPKWTAALQLLIATHGAAPYKRQVERMFPGMLRQMGFGGWQAVRALPYLAASYRRRLRAAVAAYMARLNRKLAATPFGVPPSLGGWGNSAQVAEFGVEMYFLHEAFPGLVGPNYTLRAANYLLGTHPVSSVSYISGIGRVSKLVAYGGNNRADDSFIPGGMIPGYVVIKPDFPECITRFGFLWYEDEYTVDAAATWILEANAANALVEQAAHAAKS